MTELRISGGDTRLASWSRIKADVIGVPVVTVPGDAAVGGVAMLAGMGAGIYGSPQDAIAQVRLGAPLDPDAATRALYDERFDAWRALAHSAAVRRRPEPCACSWVSTPASRSSAGRCPTIGRRSSATSSACRWCSTAWTWWISMSLLSASKRRRTSSRTPWPRTTSACIPRSPAWRPTPPTCCWRPMQLIARRPRSGSGPRSRSLPDHRPRRPADTWVVSRSPTGKTRRGAPSCGPACRDRWPRWRLTPGPPAWTTWSWRTWPSRVSRRPWP